MPAWYDAPYDLFGAELGKIRHRLLVADVGALQSTPTERAIAGELRAFAYVWLAAALERAVKDLLEGLLSELNRRLVPIDSLKPGLLGLLLDADLESVARLRDHEKLWARKCTMFGTAVGQQPAQFNGAVLPLDGKTLRPRHFEVIWQVFGLPGAAVPGPLYRLALTDLADGRNLVAHGEEDPSKFGREKITANVQNLVGRIEDLYLNLVAESDRYLTTSAYLR